MDRASTRCAAYFPEPAGGTETHSAAVVAWSGARSPAVVLFGGSAEVGGGRGRVVVKRDLSLRVHLPRLQLRVHALRRQRRCDRIRDLSRAPPPSSAAAAATFPRVVGVVEFSPTSILDGCIVICVSTASSFASFELSISISVFFTNSRPISISIASAPLFFELSMDWARYVGWMKPSWPIGKKNDNGSFVTAPLLGQVPSVPEGNQCQNSLMLQLFSLGASLTLLPYMGKDGLLKDPLFSDNYRWWVNVVFPSWWILVCMGVPCSVWGRWPFEIKIARVSTHLGMLGITLLVVMFSHWMLAVDATWVPGCLLIFATAFFFGFWIRCCFSGDM